MAGLKAARARGRKGGRPRALDAKKTELAYRLYDEKQHTVQEICQILGFQNQRFTLTLVEERRRPIPPANKRLDR